MALAGDGVLALWFDIEPDKRDDFYEWHNREHMPERLTNAGFRSGRRFMAIDAPQEYLVLYETRGPQSISSPEYMNQVRFTTDWSLRTNLMNTSRAIFRVLLSLGQGQGGTILSLRFDVADGREEELRRFLAHQVLPKLVDEPGIAGCHLLRIDHHAIRASQFEETRNKAKPMPVLGNEWLVFVEGSSEPAALDRACDAALSDAALAGAGAAGPVERGTFQIQNSLFRIL